MCVINKNNDPRHNHCHHHGVLGPGCCGQQSRHLSLERWSRDLQEDIIACTSFSECCSLHAMFLANAKQYKVLGAWMLLTVETNFFRTRSSYVVPFNGESHDDLCLVTLMKTVHGTMKQECVMSAWVEWDNCAARCGVGHEHWHSQVLVLPSPGGEDCPSSTVESTSCVKAPFGVSCAFPACTGSCVCGQQNRSNHPDAGKNGDCGADSISEVMPWHCADCKWRAGSEKGKRS